MDKKLMDCLLSDEEIENVTENIALTYIGEKAHKAKEGDLDKEISTAIAKAQLQSPKLKAYISEQKRDVIKALGQYEMGVISTEECAKRIGITTVEFNDSYYGGE